MKKNAMLKIAAVVLVAVLLTTCAISSTFAKYATDGGVKTATARVAKWGISVETQSTGDLFAKSYTNGDKTVVAATNNEGEQNYVIAPGTTGQQTFTVDVSGTSPEVSAKIDYDVAVSLTGFAAYCPVVFEVTIDGETSTITAADTNEADKGAYVQEQLLAKLNGVFADKDIPANSNVDNLDKAVTIKWTWAYDNAQGANDDADTKLGNAQDAPSITITIGSKIYQTGPAVAGVQ